MATESIHVIRAEDKTQAAVRSAMANFEGMSNKLKNVGAVVATAMAAGFAALSVSVAESIERIDKLAKVADKLSVPIENLQRLQYAVENNSDVGAEALEKALVKMTKGVAEASAGTGKAVAALERLNLSAERLKQLSPDQVFNAISESMNGVGNEADKVAIATRLFGDAGASLLPVMADGAAGLQAMAEEFDSLGYTMTRIDAAKLEAVDDAFGRVKTAMTKARDEVAVNLAPVITDLTDRFTKAAVKGIDLGEVTQKSMRFAAKAVGLLTDNVYILNQAWLGVKFSISAATQSILGALVAVREFSQKYSLDGLINGPKEDVLRKNLETQKAETEKIFSEIRENAAKPLPSESIDNWFENVKNKSEEAAQAIAKTKRQMSGGYDLSSLIGADDNSKPKKEKKEKDTSERDNAKKLKELMNTDDEMLDNALQFSEYMAKQAEEDAQRFSDAWSPILDDFSTGVGDAFGKAIFEQGKFSDIVKESVRAMARQVIESLAAIAAKKVALLLLEKAGIITTTQATVLAGGTVAAAWAPAAALSSLATLGTNAAPAAAALSSTNALSIAFANAGRVLGQAHDGLDFVPQTGTYLLERGERVVKKEDNQRGMFGGMTNINFTVNSLDPKQAAQVIIANENLIVGMIQKSYTERGRSGGPLK